MNIIKDSLSVALKRAKTPLILIALLLGPGLPARAQDDSQNVIKVITTLHEDGTRTVTQTDPENHSVQILTYDQSKKLISKVVCVTDEQTNTVNASVFSPKGKLLYKMKYLRESNGRVNEVLTYTVDDRLVSRMVYRYEANGRYKIDTYNADGVLVVDPGAARPDKKKGRPSDSH